MYSKMFKKEGGVSVIKKNLILLAVISFIMFTVGDVQGLAKKSDEKLIVEHVEEVLDEMEIIPIELLEPVIDPTVKPIELLEPVIDPTVKPIELLEPILDPNIKPVELLEPEETKLDKLKDQIREKERKLLEDKLQLP